MQHGTQLSININKVATLRNSRGGTQPSVVEAAVMAQRFGAQGITVHPRPDQRHIRFADVADLRPVVHTEFNIEGYPSKAFIDLVLTAQPDQVTLVPDPPGALTSNAGWDVRGNYGLLLDVVAIFRAHGIRTSLFLEADADMVAEAAQTGTDRVELYTESYAKGFAFDRAAAVAPFTQAALAAQAVGLGINAGHDLNLQNLRYFKQHVPGLLEVSIGHAFVSDCLYYGMMNTVQLYLAQLK